MTRTNHRRRLASPLVRRRIGPVFICVAMMFAGGGAAIRASTLVGSRIHSGAYLLDVLAWFVVLAAAVHEAASADLLFQIAPRAARNRAVLLAIAGTFSAICACVVSTWSVDSNVSPFVGVPAYALLTGGIGAGLAGMLSLGWRYGGAYAGRRIEKLGEDDW